MTCHRSGCGEPARFSVEVKLYARPHTVPAEGTTGLLVCATHAKEMTHADAQEILAPGWDKVCAVFREAGRAEPDPSLTELYLIRLL